MDLKTYLEKLYKKYNKKELIYSDPVQFIHRYNDFQDIEIAAIISSSFAYGNVKQIIKSLEFIFSKIKKPYYYIKDANNNRFKRDFKNFKHRFTNSKELCSFMINIKKMYKKYRTMEELFKKHYKPQSKNIHSTTIDFLKEFLIHKTPSLIPDPNKKSAFKRFNLFLRWMIRKDEIDIGIWNLPLSKLIIPLDTHMYNIAKRLNITKRNDTGIKTAFEITDFFKKINPSDPVKYDFSLTREPILKKFK